MVGDREHLQFLGGGKGGIFDIPLIMIHPLVLHSISHHHFQHHQDVPHSLGSQPLIQFLPNKSLHVLFAQSAAITKTGKHVLLQCQHISSHGGPLHVVALVFLPGRRDFLNSHLFHVSAFDSYY